MSDDGTRFQAGNVGTSTIANIERAMGLTYLGWSSTITGQPIPLPPEAPAPAPKPPKSNSVTQARDLLLKAERWSRKVGRNTRAKKIREMLRVGPKD
jgi:hypothetical protein